MKKFLTVSLMMLLIMSLNAFATETRVMTMGNNNTILLDEANIWQFPSRLNDYPNLAIGEFSYSADNNFANLGIHWKFGNDNPWVLGTYFSTLDAYEPASMFGGSFLDFDLMDNRRMDLLYGRQLGNNDFGFGFSYYHSSMTYDEASLPENLSKQSFSFYDFTLGLTEETGQWDIAFNFGLGTWTDEGTDGEPIAEPDGLMDIALNGRYFWQQNPNITLVPHLGLGYSKQGVKDNIASTSYEEKGTMLDLGCGMNYTPATNVLAVLDFGFMYNKMKSDNSENIENTNTNWYFPYFKLGMDADVFKWMDIRFGATSYWTSFTKEDNNGDKNNKRYPANDTYLGFGFHWNRLHVDTYTDPELFLRGFNFISGTTNNMNFQISAVYEMM